MHSLLSFGFNELKRRFQKKKNLKNWASVIISRKGTADFLDFDFLCSNNQTISTREKLCHSSPEILGWIYIPEWLSCSSSVYVWVSQFTVGPQSFFMGDKGGFIFKMRALNRVCGPVLWQYLCLLGYILLFLYSKTLINTVNMHSPNFKKKKQIKFLHFFKLNYLFLTPVTLFKTSYVCGRKFCH